MSKLSSTIAESVTGTTKKEPLPPAISGILSADWQRLAKQAKQAAADMHEVAEAPPSAAPEQDVQASAKDVVEASRRDLQERDNQRRQRRAVQRIRIPQGPRTKTKESDGMEL
ncbi:hypothetical protein [Corynebacterium alimapuense]|uniref:hypothetical protein n=1 Tax=Corynebacterium alimapuense TaxID=1576874 RepID=UPI000F812342|nr:hypothetical protein [Corynebacterium alimapuense]